MLVLVVILRERVQADKQAPYRPPNTVVQSGDFDGTTTQKADYDRKKVGCRRC